MVTASSRMAAEYPGKPGSEWQTVATPARCGLRPVSREARVGEHIGLTWKLV